MYDPHVSLWEYRAVWRRRFEAGERYAELPQAQRRTFDQLSLAGFPGTTEELVECVIVLD